MIPIKLHTICDECLLTDYQPL